MHLSIDKWRPIPQQTERVLLEPSSVKKHDMMHTAEQCVHVCVLAVQDRKDRAPMAKGNTV